MRAELRCDSKKHGELLTEDGAEPVIEIKCSSSFCGAGAGRIVLHRFNTEGKLLETLRFRDPEGRNNAP